MATADTIISPVNISDRKKLDVRVGDTVRVHLKIVEKGKTRLQPYEGLVIARKHGSEAGATITVRKVASGVGMEKIIPVYSPNVAKIEVVKRSKVRRSKLYYIREKAAKEARKKMKQLFAFDKLVAVDETQASAKDEGDEADNAEEAEGQKPEEERKEAPESEAKETETKEKKEDSNESKTE